MRLYLAVSCFAAAFLAGVCAMAFSFLVPKDLSIACGAAAVFMAAAGLFAVFVPKRTLHTK